MRSLFQMGFTRDYFWMGAEAPLTKDERDSLLPKVRAELAKLSAAKSWRDANPDWEALLGNDLQNFKDAMTRAEGLTASATAVQDKLVKNDPAAWTVAAPELNDVDAWSVFVDQLDDMVKRHAPKAGTAAAAKGGVSPLVYAGVAAAVVIGVIALT